MKMMKEVIEFFKRNPNAAAAHVVLDSVFSSAKAASRARIFWNAKRVTVVLRSEYDEWMKNQADAAMKIK